MVNLATYLALPGQRILVVDLDPQGNATSGFGDRTRRGRAIRVRSPRRRRPAAGRRDSGRRSTGCRWRHRRSRSPGAEVELVAADRRDRRLGAHARCRARSNTTGSSSMARRHSGCSRSTHSRPPTPSSSRSSASTTPSKGLAQLMATINLVRDHLNPDLEINGVVMTMFDARTNLSAEVAAEVRRHLGRGRLRDPDPAQRPAVGGPQLRPADRPLPTRLPRRGGVCGARRGVPGRASAATRSTPSDRHEPIQAGAA